MIPVDTIKTRIVTQAANPNIKIPYKGIADCFLRVLREEGIGAFYSSLTPRLVSVVPMIGIQFGVYELMKKTIVKVPLEMRMESPTVGIPLLNELVGNKPKKGRQSNVEDGKTMEAYLDEFVEDTE